MRIIMQEGATSRLGLFEASTYIINKIYTYTKLTNTKIKLNMQTTKERTEQKTMLLM